MNSRKTRKPAISICQSDHQRLSDLADSMYNRNPSVADELLGELDRARVVDDTKLRLGIARMGSILTYCTEAGDRRTVTLVFPGQADISQGRVSILTPIGVALIGLKANQSIDWKSTNGERHRLTVESVEEKPAQDALASGTNRPVSRTR